MRLVGVLMLLSGPGDLAEFRYVQTPANTCVVDTRWRHAEATDARVARQVPEYAGAYAESTATNTIFVTDLASRERARRSLEQALTERFGAYLFKLTRYQRVTFSYRQLQSWLECFLNAARPGDIRSAWLSPQENRMRLQVSDDSARIRLEALARVLDVPSNAFVIQRASPADPPLPQRRTTLRRGGRVGAT